MEDISGRVAHTAQFVGTTVPSIKLVLSRKLSGRLLRGKGWNGSVKIFTLPTHWFANLRESESQPGLDSSSCFLFQNHLPRW
jgi:hypothetical protein